MDQTYIRRGDLDIDLESGGTTSEEEGSEIHSSSAENTKKLLNRAWSGLLGKGSPDNSGGDCASSNSNGSLLDPDEITMKKVRRADKSREKMINSKGKKPAKKEFNSIKPPKPPRPPRAPLLNAADVKLVKEISELAVLKRKRIERMKALKKMKKENLSLINSNFFAMVVTVLFFIVIVMQGFLGSSV